MADPRGDILTYLAKLKADCVCKQTPGPCGACQRTNEIKDEVAAMGYMVYVHHDRLGPEWGKGELPSEVRTTLREPTDHVDLDVAYASGKKVWIEDREPSLDAWPHDIVHISPHVAAWVLSYYGEGGYAPGSFTQTLIKAMVAADPVHFRMLSRTFPELAAAIHTASHESGGIARLRFLAHPHDLPGYIRDQIEDEAERTTAEGS